jgi:predicted cobalt transporter CbtA
MTGFGAKGLLILLAVVLFIIGAFSEENQTDLLFWGLAVFAAAHLADALPLGNLMGPRRDTTRNP